MLCLVASKVPAAEILNVSLRETENLPDPGVEEVELGADLKDYLKTIPSESLQRETCRYPVVVLSFLGWFEGLAI